MLALAEWADGGFLNSLVIDTYWLWPLLEIIHFIGLSLLLGAMLVVDLRLAGWLRSISLEAIHRLLPWAALGFCMNLVSGALFFFGDPFRYALNIGFRIKMILILAAGLNALLFFVKIRPAMGDWADAKPPPFAQAVAYLSLIVWAGVLLLGRLIPYVGTG